MLSYAGYNEAAIYCNLTLKKMVDLGDSVAQWQITKITTAFQK